MTDVDEPLSPFFWKNASSISFDSFLGAVSRVRSFSFSRRYAMYVDKMAVMAIKMATIGSFKERQGTTDSSRSSFSTRSSKRRKKRKGRRERIAGETRKDSSIETDPRVYFR